MTPPAGPSWQSKHIPEGPECADLPDWLGCWRGTPPAVVLDVMVSVYDWLSTYKGDRVEDVLLSLGEDMTAHGHEWVEPGPKDREVER